MIREKSAIYDKQTEDYLICLRAYTYRHSKARRYTFIDNRKRMNGAALLIYWQT